jgi:hypothetical protein
MSRSPTTHPTSDAAEQRRRMRRRARTRGAILVEALIVISLLILGFMGLVFFRAYYTKTLVATRLARGSILVYSMTGCGDSNHPREWIGNRDLANLTAAAPNGAEQPARSTAPPATAGQEGGSVLSRLPGLSGDGGGIMNPISTSDLSGRVRVRTSSGALSPERTVFDQQVHARSFVSCGDPIRDGDFEDAIKYITGIFDTKPKEDK